MSARKPVAVLLEQAGDFMLALSFTCPDPTLARRHALAAANGYSAARKRREVRR